MGMMSMMNIGCTNLHNPICDWLIKIYDKEYRSFVIPGRGRIPRYLFSTRSACLVAGWMYLTRWVMKSNRACLLRCFLACKACPSRPLLVTWLGIWNLVDQISRGSFLCFWSRLSLCRLLWLSWATDAIQCWYVLQHPTLRWRMHNGHFSAAFFYDCFVTVIFFCLLFAGQDRRCQEHELVKVHRQFSSWCFL